MAGYNVVCKLFDLYAAGKLAPEDYFELLVELLDEALRAARSARRGKEVA
jgi:hypothetical protein